MEAEHHHGPDMVTATVAFNTVAEGCDLSAKKRPNPSVTMCGTNCMAVAD
ncbi:MULTISPECIES: hypothetical protein [unclassified Meridianimarinicoccus]|nr:hypothetical protein [Fluviibacterium sp. MJW13]